MKGEEEEGYMGLRLNGSSFDVVRLLARERWVTIGWS